MNRPLLGLTVLLLTLAQPCTAQSSLEQIADSITREGRKLYTSELTSWNGTDIFVQRFADINKIGGYFSYRDGDTSKCIFVSKGDTPQVIGCVAFDDPHNIPGARVDLAPRAFTEQEHQLYLIREKALKDIRSDTFYTGYPRTEFNLIPTIEGKERKVIILTGPKDNGILILGNDYQLSFDENDQLVGRRRLHQGVFVADYGAAEKKGTKTEMGMHTHLPATGDYITPTDICTLMLYEKFAKWKQYLVLSKDYVSIWDCQQDHLLILTMDAWNKIINDQKQRRGK